MSRSGWGLARGALVVIALGCSDSITPGGALSGRWRADSNLSTLGIPLEVTLVQRDTVVTGSGMYGGTNPRVVSVIGHYSSLPVDTAIILTFAAVNTIPAIMFGRLSANEDTLSGRYQWTIGLPEDTVTLVRY